jgi:hypothetical protein
MKGLPATAEISEDTPRALCGGMGSGLKYNSRLCTLIFKWGEEVFASDMSRFLHPALCLASSPCEYSLNFHCTVLSG